MEKFQPIINQIKEKEHQQKIKDLFAKITETYPQLDTTVKWNQPMFTDHGTFIIAFSFAKNHFSIAPEKAAIRALEKNIQEAGYVYTDNVIKVPWKSVINWELIEQLISFNIED
ncbi:TPA: iron chaperone, partial [Enterococcus faecium]|nr:iron chaperone [Enterococcus faecium]HAQ1711887.1 iron chaperone [Enterococcus faecium]HAQ1841607.1 iron chaperone [Enterococcus faecium]HAQ1844539.1 iron chaperone [Enterococcus faecium]HAQ1847404.1 iron chaperone [Enterococcus faecium]